jgi:hypothetical protein
MSAAANPAAPPPTIATEAGVFGDLAVGDRLRGLGPASFSRTKALSPTRSTRQHGTESSAGARTASPVWRLKQA